MNFEVKSRSGQKFDENELLLMLRLALKAYRSMGFSQGHIVVSPTAESLSG